MDIDNFGKKIFDRCVLQRNGHFFLDFYTFRERYDQDYNLKLNDGAVKLFLSTKGTADDVSDTVKNFLDYVDRGIVAGSFVKELDAAVSVVKSDEKARLEFMTYQMALLERELEGEERGHESVAVNLINMGMAIEKIQEATSLSLEKIKELAQKIKSSANPQ